MKKITFYICFALFALAGYGQTKSFLDQPYLEVSCTADTSLVPDEIYIEIQIRERDSKDKVSVEDQERDMVNALKELGIDVEKNLTTKDIASNFKAYLFKSKDILKSKQYMLKVADAVTATKVFIRLEEMNISNTSIDHVSHSGVKEIENVLRSRAVVNARVKAIAMTKPLGQNVGPAIFISETDYHQGFEQQLQGRVSGVVVRQTSGKTSRTYEIPDIEFENIKVKATVYVKFVLMQ